MSPGRAPVPEVTFEAARVRVQKLEADLLSMAGFPGPEVDVLQAGLTRAKAARSTSIECASDSVSANASSSGEAHRGAGQSARSRVQTVAGRAATVVQQEVVAGVPIVSDRPTVPHVTSEVVRLQDQVAHLQAQWATRVAESKKGRVRPEDFMCQTVEELIQWIDARQSDIQHAIATGNATEVSRLAGLMAQGNRAVEELDIQSIGVDSYGGVNFEHL